MYAENWCCGGKTGYCHTGTLPMLATLKAPTIHNQAEVATMCCLVLESMDTSTETKKRQCAYLTGTSASPGSALPFDFRLSI